MRRTYPAENIAPVSLKPRCFFMEVKEDYG